MRGGSAGEEEFADDPLGVGEPGDVLVEGDHGVSCGYRLCGFELAAADTVEQRFVGGGGGPVEAERGLVQPAFVGELLPGDFPQVAPDREDGECEGVRAPVGPPVPGDLEARDPGFLEEVFGFDSVGGDPADFAVAERLERADERAVVAALEEPFEVCLPAPDRAHCRPSLAFCIWSM